MKLIHTRGPLARGCVFQIYTEDFEGYKVERSEKNDFSYPPHWQSQGVRIEDKPDNCKETCLEQSDLFFLYNSNKDKDNKM